MSTGPEGASRSSDAGGSVNVRTWRFKEQLVVLPESVRNLASSAFQKFLEDPDHPSLRKHQLKKTRAGKHVSGSQSVSISMKYRAIYYINEGVNVWYWIGSHNDYENFAGRK